LDLRLVGGKLTGSVELGNKSGDRGYVANLLGFVETRNGRVVRPDMVAKGLYWGRGHSLLARPKEDFPWPWRSHWRVGVKRQIAGGRKDRKGGWQDTLNNGV